MEVGLLAIAVGFYKSLLSSGYYKRLTNLELAGPGAKTGHNVLAGTICTFDIAVVCPRWCPRHSLSWRCRTELRKSCFLWIERPQRVPVAFVVVSNCQARLQKDDND